MPFKGQKSALSVSQIQSLEQYAINTVGIPSVVLMDRAGEAVARSILRRMGRKRHFSVIIVCGTGNNGGDGFVTARYLWAAGVKARVIVAGRCKDLKHDPKVFYNILKALDVEVIFIQRLSRSMVDLIDTADVLVDALFGIGLNRPLNGLFRELVLVMNESRRKIWSVDIPSGLDGTTGKVMGKCVKASNTVTFGYLKKGFFINDGPVYTGRLETADIGIPEVLFKKAR